MEKIRNIAIIAHVDHGKTTMVDQLLRQSGTFRANQAQASTERVMDSMDLEREKGITIKAKNAAFQYKDYHINIVDTPGHADFGGEVERSLKMVDGVLLVVDSTDGPQAQTKFVLKKALAIGARPIVVLNKVDRENSRPNVVLDMVFELFLELNATDEQLDFPIVYASGKVGFASKTWPGHLTEEIRNGGMTALYDTIVEKIAPPVANPDKHFELLVANLDYSEYVGRIAIGKIYGGSVKVGDPMVCLHKDGRKTKGKVTQIMSHAGLAKIEIPEAFAGNIVGIAGIDEVYIGETITDKEDRTALEFVDIDPPTINMQILVNDSPLAGKEGKFLTARHIRDRLIKETRTNVSLIVKDTDSAAAYQVSARGEMQIAVLVEQMRREGFELMVSRPEVIYRKDEKGDTLEPIENLYVDIPQENLGDVLQAIAARKGEVTDMKHATKTVLVEAVIPTRGLIGFETDLVNLTRGTGIMSHIFKEYGPKRGEIVTRQNGVLVSMEGGEATGFAINNIQERGILFVAPGEECYEGMIVGENSRPDDMAVNPCKAKALTNMRSQGDGKGIQLQAPRVLTLERSLEYIAADEYVEATPTKLRIRKKILNEDQRRRTAKQSAS
ncbi:GTP-binding protein [Verrucomicrobium sp. GAS474]|uniref:translational GTPase TypA n=1 Tax=Verrucomicrobium sp. GAS474 TaxID=1882831 RepID=UPI0008796B88|nr:translational GTPase TypA [Verrucomicrobium sp. GAS474]SDU16611.1 GTP-binding protein [Verrucomicrobium sp. GAS474]